MPVVQSVELLFDAESEAAIRAEWMVAATTLAVPLPGSQHRPHLTLAVASAIAAGLDADLATLVGLLPIDLTLGPLLVLGSHHRPILGRSVVPHTDLLALHARCAEVVADCPGRPAESLPGRWTPHVTIQRRIPPDRLGRVVEALPRTVQVVRGVAVRRWDGEARRDRVVAGVAQ